MNKYAKPFAKFPFDLGRPCEHTARVHDGEWASGFDLDCAFFQQELDPEVSLYFCFVGPDGKTYAFNRLPMGFVASCEVQQDFTREMIDKRTIPADVYIDGARFIGSREEVSEALDAAEEKCCEFNAQATFAKPAQGQTWLGVNYDFVNKKVWLTQTLIEKIENLRNPVSWTYRDMMAAFSYLFYGSAILRIDLAPFFHAVKFYSRRSRGVPEDLELPVKIWPSIKKTVDDWFDVVLSNTPTVPAEANEEARWLLYTDASTDGWGGSCL